MTKKIRVENADSSTWKVVVETWRKGVEGEPDVKIADRELNYPCDLGDFMIWGDQYLVVKENGERKV